MNGNQIIVSPEHEDFKILPPPPSPADKTWRRFRKLVKMAIEACDEAEFEAQEKYTKAAWQTLDLWFDLSIKELKGVAHQPFIFKKRGEK